MSNVLWWAPVNDGSSYYRMTLPAMAVQWQGHECRVTTRISAEDLNSADVLVVGRPARGQAHDVMTAFTRSGRPVIADIDDDYWHIDESNERAFRFWNDDLKAGLTHGLSLADKVTCASERLAEIAGHFSNSTYIPNGLHAQWLGIPRDYNPDVLTLGWAGTDNTLAWIGEIIEPVNDFLRKNPKSRFVAIGPPVQALAKAGFDMSTGRVGSTGYIDDHDEYLKAMFGFDVLLAPYRSTAFTEAKFATKGLEAGFLGIPLAASAIEPYANWLGTEGEHGLRVSQPYQWNKALKVMKDPAVRQVMGENARSHASHYIMQSLGLKWTELIEGLLK